MDEIHKTDNGYILDVLVDEEERLMDNLAEKLPDDLRYLFYKYLAVTKKIREIKLETA